MFNLYTLPSGYRSVPDPNPALEAASDDATNLRNAAAKVTDALRFIDALPAPDSRRADDAIADVYRVLEDVAAKLRGAADDVVSDAEEE